MPAFNIIDGIHRSPQRASSNDQGCDTSHHLSDGTLNGETGCNPTKLSIPYLIYPRKPRRRSSQAKGGRVELGVDEPAQQPPSSPADANRLPGILRQHVHSREISLRCAHPSHVPPLLCQQPQLTRPPHSPVTVLLLNAICIPSEDRFLARGTFFRSLPLCIPSLQSPHPMGGNWIGRLGRDIQVWEMKTNKTPTVGLAPATFQRGFGQEADSSVKYKLIQLIASVRTVMRGKVPARSRAPCMFCRGRLWLTVLFPLVGSTPDYNQHAHHSVRAHPWLRSLSGKRKRRRGRGGGGAQMSRFGWGERNES